MIPLDTGRKLNVLKTLVKTWRLTFNLERGLNHICSKKSSEIIILENYGRPFLKTF